MKSKINFRTEKDKVLTSYTLWFVITALVVFLPFYAKGLSLVWKIDGIGQYYPAFLYIGQWIREQFSGLPFLHGIPIFDFKIAMGENVISSLNYYGFGDPFNILAVFSNVENGAYVFTAVILLRLYLAGVSFKAYCRYMKLDGTLSSVGALSYVFSGYALWGGLMYTQFLSPLIYLPLLLCGCEKVWKEKKYGFLILASLYAMLCNLYFMYMVGIYLAVYCLVRTFFLFGHNVKKMALNCLKCAAAVLVGFALSLPINFWFIQGLLFSTRSDVSAIEVLLDLRNWIPSVRKCIAYFAGFLPRRKYWGSIPLLVCVTLFFSLFSWKTRQQKQCALAGWIGTLAASLPITYIFFSGFNGNYDRWHFLLIFSYMVVFAAVGNTIIRERFPGKEKKIKNIVGFLCILNLMACGLIFCHSAGMKFADEFLPARSVEMYVDTPVNYSKTIQSDTGVYRISHDTLTNVNGRPENIAMINDYYGLTFWFSIVNQNTQEIVNRLKNGHENTWRGYGLDNDLLYESMAGVKYYLRHDNDRYPPEYEKVEQVDFYGEAWEVYRNPYALPMIYAFPKTYYEESLEKKYYDRDVTVLGHAVKAENVVIGTNRISATINMDGEGYLLLAVPYSPGWKAYVDGEETEVFLSDILYAAIRLGEGRHEVEFVY